MRQLEHKLHQESVLQFPAARIYLATLSRSFRCNELHDSRLVETWIMFKHQIANTSRSKLFMSCISIYIYILENPPPKLSSNEPGNSHYHSGLKNIAYCAEISTEFMNHVISTDLTELRSAGLPISAENPAIAQAWTTVLTAHRLASPAALSRRI